MAGGFRWAVLGLAAAVLAACGPSMGDVNAQYKDKLDPIRARLKAIAIALPEPGTAVSVRLSAVDPLPVYRKGDVPGSNTAFFAIEEALGQAGPPVFDALLMSDLAYALRATGPNNPMSEATLKEGASGDYTAQFERAQRTLYAVILRPVAYDKAVAIDATTFEGGTLDLEVFFTALSDGRVLATCRLTAEAAANVSYSHKKDDDPKERLAAFANSTLFESAVSQIGTCLATQTGGTFDTSGAAP